MNSSNLKTSTKPRVFLVEPLIDQQKIDLLSKHGDLIALTSVATYPMPAVWNTLAMSQWIRDALLVLHMDDNGFNYSRDYLALVGNALALAQITATLIVQTDAPYKIRCLSYSRKNAPGEYAYVLLEECEYELTP